MKLDRSAGAGLYSIAMHDDPELRHSRATAHAARRSRPVETLLAAPPCGVLACDVLVIGSGYGGSFAAAELARTGRSVWVLERGREYARGDFPETLGELPGHVQLTRGSDRAPRGRRDALFDLRIDEDVAVLTGCGLGGGSLVNAGVVLAPRPEVFDDRRWPQALRADRGAGLAAAFGHVRTVLGAAPLESPATVPKYAALARLAGAMPGTRIGPAPIAVSRRDGINAVGVEQRACIDCGNCVTGCNHDAKNTLAMNAIPLAIARGARFWTGARAIDVRPADGGPAVPGSGAPTRWRVRGARVATLGAHRDQEVFEIHAHTVVIAAGSLGSTELLLRSREAGLALSERLGSGFSGNGDQMAFGIGQRRPVGAVARPDPQAPTQWSKVGPTIVGVIDRADGGAMSVRGGEGIGVGPCAGRPAVAPDPAVASCSSGDAGWVHGALPRDAVVQEAAMPAALRPLLATLMSSASFAHGAAHDAPHAFTRRAPGADPIAAPESLADHCQVLLAMGADAADGHLRLEPPVPGRSALGERRLRISADYARRDPTIAAIGAALAAASRPAQDGPDGPEGHDGPEGPDGFDGGWYVPNPLWKPLPDGGERAFGDLDGRTITVHPLGGCPMGEDRHCGVTDADGAVFDASAADPTAVHAGLHVLDGAILPTSLGVNPMLTIAALAVRAAVGIDARLGVRGRGERAVAERGCPSEPAPEPMPGAEPILGDVPTPGDVPGRDAGPVPGRADPARHLPRPISRVPPCLSAPPFERARVPVQDAATTLRFVEVLHTPAGEPVDPGALAALIDARTERTFDTRPAPDAQPAADTTRHEHGKPGRDTPSASDALRAGRVGLVLELDARVALAAWTAQPGTAWKGTATLSLYDFGDDGAVPHATGFAGAPVPPRGRQPRHAVGIAATLHPIATGTCELRMLVADPPAGRLDTWRRRLSALDRFCRTRPLDDWTRWPLRLLRPVLDGRGAPADPASPRRARLPARLRALVAGLAAYRRVLDQHGVRRVLQYSVCLPTDPTDPTGAPGPTIVLNGSKHLAYADDARDLWDALLGIDLSASVEQAAAQTVARTVAGPWRMQVDVLDLLRRGVYRIDDAPDTPTAIAAIAAAGALWVRALAGAHFWSFPGRTYGVRVPVPIAFAPLSTLTLADGTRIAPSQHRFDVARRRDDPDGATLTLRVSRYRRAPEHSVRGALLLVHGLAHGGEVFVTPTAPRPLAARFVEDGWDVFVLDHRLSSHLGETPRQASTIDDIAAHDIPGAFDAIDRLRGRAEPIHVLAHCVGAAAVSMAILSGRLTRGDGRSRIAALVLHAVHPWVVPSPWNRVSAALAGFYQDFVGDTVLDPIPPERSTAIDQLVDRLAASIPWSEAEARRHRADPWRDPSGLGEAICNRMTLFYGREWLHANLTEATHDALHTLVGPAHVDVFRHIFFLALRHRLTDANGDNVYLLAGNVAAHWTFPTLFATGRDNRVFDASSAARSYQAMSVLRSDPALSRTGRAGLYLPDDVGHMDFLFGRFNHLPASAKAGPGRGGHGVQDTLAAFLDAPDAWLDRQEAEGDSPGSAWSLARRSSPQLAAWARPWTGPLPRYERSADGASIELQLWVELHPHRTHGPQTWQFDALGRDSPWTMEDLTEGFRDCAGPGFGLPGSYHLARALWLTGLSGGAVSATGQREAESSPASQQLGDVGASGNTLYSEKLDLALLTAGPGGKAAGPAVQRAAPSGDEPGDRPAASAVAAGSPGTTTDAVDALGRELVGPTLHVPIDTIVASPWFSHLEELLAPGACKRDRSMTFLLASCRWPGLVFERAAVDRPVHRMIERVDAARRGRSTPAEAEATAPDGARLSAPTCPDAPAPIDALFLLGDQIYADALADAFDTTVPAERAARRYRDAWSGDSRLDEHHAGGAMGALLERVPCWSVVDDHEFVDDWPGGSDDRPPDAAFRRQFAAAVAYQWRRGEAPGHGQRSGSHPLGTAGRDRPHVGPDRVERGLWQPFEAATLRCFALDIRTERTLRTAANRETATIMGSAQHAALAHWLKHPPPGCDPAAPPLILCGSPIGLPRAEEADMPGATLRADDWNGYPASCRALLRAILDADIKHAVMLCGDPHYSCVVRVDVEDRGVAPADVEHRGAAPAEGCAGGNAAGASTPDARPVRRRCSLHVIVASGLNASLPFANGHPRELLGGTVPLPFSGEGLSARATATPLSGAPRQYTEFAVHLRAAGQPWLEVSVFDEHGQRVAAQCVGLT